MTDRDPTGAPQIIVEGASIAPSAFLTHMAGEPRLTRLRESIGAKAEAAYNERDAADDASPGKAYAAGKSHAYGIAKGEVRKAEKEPES